VEVGGEVKKPIEDVALELIEAIAAEKRYTQPKSAWGIVFKAAHTARLPDCRKNHPRWEGVVRRAWKLAAT
jgi:hypothetical protein